MLSNLAMILNNWFIEDYEENAIEQLDDTKPKLFTKTVRTEKINKRKNLKLE